MDQQHAYIGVASLAYSAQSGLATSTALSGDQAEICSKFASRFKCRRIANRRDQSCRRQWSNTWNRSDSLTCRLLSLPGNDLPVQFLNLVFDTTDEMKLIT